MKKLLLAAAAMATASALVGLVPVGAGQTPQSGGAAKQPIVVPVAQPPQSTNPIGYLPTTDTKNLPLPAQPGANQMGGVPNSIASAFELPTTETSRSRELDEFLERNFDEPDVNKDIAVHPGCGAYLISVISYKGKDAPRLAREMVMELRNNPKYKLAAYVHTQGAEAAKAEQRRILAQMEEAKKMYATFGQPPDRARIKWTRYELECAVLVGGFKDPVALKAACERMKGLEQPDPSKVKLLTEFEPEVDAKGLIKGGKEKILNPFKSYVVVPNPCKAAARPAGIDPEDMAAMKSLNADESYSLLKCPKNYTLAVKQFSLSMQIVTAGNGNTMFGKPPTPTATSKEDTVALKAHVVAEILRKKYKVEAYVLHTKFVSIVTVGSYDAPNDPRLLSDQQWLPQLNEKLDPAIRLVSQPRVMLVPR